ncbi:MAG: PIN/TRAM domain-containing protein [Cyanobacteria bacterium P01_H01_bin.121]
MIDAIVIISFIFFGIGLGFYGIDFLPDSALTQVTNLDGLRSVTAGFGALIFGVIGLVVQTAYRRIQAQVRSLPPDILLSRAVGLVVGLLIANLILAPILLLPIPAEFGFIKPLAAVLSSLLFGVSGVSVADTNGRALLRLINPNSVETLLVSEGTLKPAITKILDTSCIIDGRFRALIDTNFLEGQLLVPQFVLQELQQLADSANDQKRIRGRLGLEVITEARSDYPDRIVIHNTDYDDIGTVDAKLVRLAQELSGTLLTNDYNLSKVANFQEVSALNINGLAQALRPTYLPGDSLQVKVLRAGKEPQQGVGYLDDGTMVVVEEGHDYIGNELDVVVTGALQTSAGRMIFAKPNAEALV